MGEDPLQVEVSDFTPDPRTLDGARINRRSRCGNWKDELEVTIEADRL